MFKFIIVASLLAFTSAKSIRDQEPVQVQVYYETLCPDSIAFITQQLYPNYLIFGPDGLIDIELVPYGHASESVEDGIRTFTCQHGPNECYGNKVQACVINSASVNQTINFVFCSENSGNPADPTVLEQCALDNGLSWADIQQCLDSDLAGDLLSANGKKTDLVKPNFIPTITFNGEFTQTNQDAALVNLKKVICSFIGNPLTYC
ncbi:hypothetical protein GWI33_018698 [Rhynchophorus ferrugineus]|uniref:Gamma-interferon inducible lysosomal thiol reductase n=1 Tax=Rhynchophorus ferrugineus TaxID=354439 RepID=A0A834HZQ5_RHYFE|nr:hypothetical protein GWI33_018698 [Rhynchophorus ferrugineus]